MLWCTGQRTRPDSSSIDESRPCMVPVFCFATGHSAVHLNEWAVVLHWMEELGSTSSCDRFDSSEEPACRHVPSSESRISILNPAKILFPVCSFFYLCMLPACSVVLGHCRATLSYRSDPAPYWYRLPVPHAFEPYRHGVISIRGQIASLTHK